MADIKRPFRSYNGSGWDRHLFETSEDQIVAGFSQQLVPDLTGKWAYKKFPGGLAIAWCFLDINNFTNDGGSGGVKQIVNYPFTFKQRVTAWVTPNFVAGFPMISTGAVETNKCIIFANEKAQGLYIHLMVIGEVA